MLSHLLYQATCYLPYTCSLLLLVCVLPALAFFPSLICHPLKASAIPIISIFIVNVIAVMLLRLHDYRTTIVCWITIGLGIIACIRLTRTLKTHTFQWTQTEKLQMGMNIGLILPLVAESGLSAFTSNDALASWNYWALHYYAQAIPDTLGYPPFFPLWLSYCYHVLGTTEYQGAVKAMLVICPLTMMNAIALSLARYKDNLLLIFILISVSVFPGLLSFHFYSFYAVGYADPLLAASVAISLALFLNYQKYLEYDCLFYAVLTAIVASLSKQPGLLWGLWMLPFLIIQKIIARPAERISLLLLLGLLITPAIIWLHDQGAHFYHNQGVIKASLNDAPFTIQNVLLTVWHSIKKYLLFEPPLLLLLMGVLYTAKTRESKNIVWLFLVPGLGLWFALGSYDMRLGLYLLVAASVLLAAQWPSWTISRYPILSSRAAYRLSLSMGLVLFAILSITMQINPHVTVPYRIYPLQAGRSNIYHYFGNQAEFIYRHIYNHPEIRLYARQRIIAGIFYGHTSLVIPADMPLNTHRNPLTQYRPHYILAAFCDRQSDECLFFRALQQRFPKHLQRLPMGKTRYDHELYIVTG